jgi:hypothetical protein
MNIPPPLLSRRTRHPGFFFGNRSGFAFTLADSAFDTKVLINAVDFGFAAANSANQAVFQALIAFDAVEGVDFIAHKRSLETVTVSH